MPRYTFEAFIEASDNLSAEALHGAILYALSRQHVECVSSSIQKGVSVPVVAAPNYAAGIRAFKKTVACWAPEWVWSDDHIEKVVERVIDAGAT